MADALSLTWESRADWAADCAGPGLDFLYKLDLYALKAVDFPISMVNLKIIRDSAGDLNMLSFFAQVKELDAHSMETLLVKRGRECSRLSTSI